MKRFYVYTHEDLQGRVFYVGKGHGRRATDLKNRKGRHLYKLRKLGDAGVVVRVFPVHDERHALTIEQQLIALMRRAGIDLCNIARGGDGVAGVPRTPEYREKIRRSLIGHPVSEQARQKIGAANRSRKITDATRAKLQRKTLSEAHRNALLKANTGRARSEASKAKAREKMKGRKLSDEHRAKLSASHSGKKQSPELVAKRAAGVRAACAARRARKEGAASAPE